MTKKSAPDLREQARGETNPVEEKGTNIMTVQPLPLNGAPLMWDNSTREFVPAQPDAAAETNGRHPTDTTATESTRRDRAAAWADEHIPMTVVIGGAGLATGLSAWGMWGFGVDILNMDPWVSGFSMGVLEIIMTGLALMARRDARRGLPTRSLMIGVVGLSTLSGALAALDELHNGNGYAAVFRFVLPLIVAWVWHHVLVGDRAHATGRTLADIRYGMSVNRYLDAWEDYEAATGDKEKTRAGKRLTRSERGLAKRVPTDRIDTMVAAARAARDAASASGKAYAVSLRQRRITSADTTTPDIPRDTAADTAGDTMAETVSDTPRDTTADTAIADTVARPVSAVSDTAPKRVNGRHVNGASAKPDNADAEAQRARVRDLLAQDMTIPAIAAEMGVSTSTVNRRKRELKNAGGE